ncbi:MAG: geranylgeranylglycerol-phosphate geranylgeranyltransferase [bacterium]|nr:geranylgeranylglycerol-phosphate geranylgeranyltransferase [bacterium]
MKQKIIAGIEVIRPLNGVIAAVSVLIGAALTKHGITQTVWLAIISCFLITGGGNAINDITDKDIDRVNKPQRPIPSGRLSGKEVVILSLFLCILGIAIAGLASFRLLKMAILVTILLFLYSFSLKRRGLRGNIAVAFLGGLPFIYGGISVKYITPTIIPFILAFFLHLSRELLKDIEDMEGDRRYTRTFPLVYGIKNTIKLVNTLVVILIAFTFFPYIAGIYGLPYLVAVLLLVNIPLAVLLYLINRNSISFSHASKLLKSTMLGGIVALLLAGL